MGIDFIKGMDGINYDENKLDNETEDLYGFGEGGGRGNRSSEEELNNEIAALIGVNIDEKKYK